ncbi:hypothetical protein P280DRAFT_473754 [Massarina eburnea CBS 473.64]|uniref:4Fe-4S ferredoxin-type domain-containing protein n=1 Tax=Massarina eburnea CBS 473.64 TaxID=1395130 RepID=A0A6A6RJL5_9PLEO|nr:hypothetical protein P280DRAFT_473754 [Massarina eburnea CBS 473.64]
MLLTLLLPFFLALSTTSSPVSNTAPILQEIIFDFDLGISANINSLDVGKFPGAITTAIHQVLSQDDQAVHDFKICCGIAYYCWKCGDQADTIDTGPASTTTAVDVVDDGENDPCCFIIWGCVNPCPWEIPPDWDWPQISFTQLPAALTAAITQVEKNKALGSRVCCTAAPDWSCALCSHWTTGIILGS